MLKMGDFRCNAIQIATEFWAILGVTGGVGLRMNNCNSPSLGGLIRVGALYFVYSGNGVKTAP